MFGYIIKEINELSKNPDFLKYKSKQRENEKER
jgi:hypothetical protein